MFVGYNDLSPNIINALIATEDVRFAEHSGIDAYALTRAVVKRGILMQKNAGGGSTITQQLSKQLYSPSADNVMERLFQKPIEWVIAVKLERYYTKEEILTMYLNKFDFLEEVTLQFLQMLCHGILGILLHTRVERGIDFQPVGVEVVFGTVFLGVLFAPSKERVVLPVE